jgi:CRP-like cAMP-binding protein
VVVRQDTPGREFLIVAEGQLTVTRDASDATELLNVVSAGDVIGEMSLLHGGPRTATVTTLTPAKVYAGSAQEFFAFMEAAPSAAERIIATAAQRRQSNVAA